MSRLHGFMFWQTVWIIYTLFLTNLFFSVSEYYNTHEPQLPLPRRGSQSEAPITAVENSKCFVVTVVNKTIAAEFTHNLPRNEKWTDSNCRLFSVPLAAHLTESVIGWFLLKLMIQPGEFHVDPRAPAVSHITLSKRKMNGTFTTGTRDIWNNSSHVQTLLS